VIAAPLGVALVLQAESTEARTAAIVYATAVAFMFGASGLYNGITWRPKARQLLCRVDHTGIYLLIAGSYTSVALLVLTGNRRAILLAVVWAGAGAAVLIKCLWIRAPKRLSAVVAIVLGWAGVFVLPELLDRVAPGGIVLLVAGGIAYTLGGILYALRRPVLVPSVFGYHELFHALVIVGVGLQYAAFAFYVLPR
jgi:hemolysin III